MRCWLRILTSVLLLCLSMTITAQENIAPFEPPLESGEAFALYAADDGTLSLAALPTFPLPSGTTDIDFNPQDPSRWARVDNVGILRFVPAGASTEGVYTFKPFFDGFQVTDPDENKYYVRHVEWSPDGEQLAFFIRNNAQMNLDQGVWFWQPRQELATDPAYQLLRPCPPYCDQAGLPASAAGWEIRNLAWSSDNRSLLVRLILLEDNQRGFTVRTAERDPNITQAITPPPLYAYSHAHWATDGTQLVVSGTNPEGDVMFGLLERDGTLTESTLAEEIGMAWVQDAVQMPDGDYLMLGSTVDANAPQQLITAEGDPLTAPIGTAAPSSVRWSPNKQAVLLRVNGETYAATVNGEVYNLTQTINSSPLLDWTHQPLPAAYTDLSLSAPVTTADDLATATPTPTATATSVPALPTNAVPLATVGADAPAYSIGEILRLTDGTLSIYNDPVSDAIEIGSLATGGELVITGGPVVEGDVTWYRVQTIDYTGWVRLRDMSNLGVPNE